MNVLSDRYMTKYNRNHVNIKRGSTFIQLFLVTGADHNAVQLLYNEWLGPTDVSRRKIRNSSTRRKPWQSSL